VHIQTKTKVMIASNRVLAINKAEKTKKKTRIDHFDVQDLKHLPPIYGILTVRIVTVRETSNYRCVLPTRCTAIAGGYLNRILR